MPRIALIHAVSVAIEPVASAFKDDWPEAETTNLLEDSLAADLARAGELDEAMVERFRALAAYAVQCGSDGILFTCSAFGEAIEAAAEDHAPMPVLKPNEAMFEDALDAGPRIGLLATFGPSVPSMEREFETMSANAGGKTRLKTACVPKAMEALRAGDAETHNKLVAKGAKELADCDAVMLAQFSTAQAKDLVADAIGVPILTSPESAVAKLKSALGGDEG